MTESIGRNRGDDERKRSKAGGAHGGRGVVFPAGHNAYRDHAGTRGAVRDMADAAVRVRMVCGCVPVSLPEQDRSVLILRARCPRRGHVRKHDWLHHARSGCAHPGGACPPLWRMRARRARSELVLRRRVHVPCLPRRTYLSNERHVPGVRAQGARGASVPRDDPYTRRVQRIVLVRA